MKQKIRKIVTAALLSMAVLGMSVPALPASAATGSVNDGCDHLHKTVSSSYKTYSNPGPQEHRVNEYVSFKCQDCEFSGTEVLQYNESHTQVSGTVKCVCGYYLH